MSTSLISIAVLGMAFCAEIPRTGVADGAVEAARKDTLVFEVVLVEVDLKKTTITADSRIHIVPPSGTTGGVAYLGNLPAGTKPARFERLPVMPEVELKEKGLRSGMRVDLRLEVVKGALVIVGIERRLDAEKIGIDFLDVSASKPGR